MWGVEFSLRIEEVTELVHGALVVCTIAAGHPAAFTASFCCVEQGEERRKKNVGDLKCDLRALYTRCVSICSANTVWQRGCASGVGSVCRVSLCLTWLVNGARFGKIMECVRLSFLLHS